MERIEIMKRKNAKELQIDLNLSKENWMALDEIAKKNKMKTSQIIDAILECELDIVEYIIKRRSRLCRKLKEKSYVLSFLSRISPFQY